MSLDFGNLLNGKHVAYFPLLLYCLNRNKFFSCLLSAYLVKLSAAAEVLESVSVYKFTASCRQE